MNDNYRGDKDRGRTGGRRRRNAQIMVNLYSKRDQFGSTYFVGKIYPGELPIRDEMLDLSKGLVFLIWPHDSKSDEVPQMAIKPMQENLGSQNDDDEVWTNDGD